MTEGEDLHSHPMVLSEPAEEITIVVSFHVKEQPDKEYPGQ